MTRALRDLPVGEGSLPQVLVPLGIAVGGAVLILGSCAMPDSSR